ncbi:DUF6190 family protein [Sphaerisporangium sp. NPDC051017]|uniref:DUF6190 family protein n=1 Tax=Sphaerisporangium sp. NPDC051017 TaxID=3154636 RepID=UPI003413409D
MASEIFIDAALFMGMHSQDDDVRRACKGFFARHLADERVVLNQEQVGKCDALVWLYGREEQDAYYPFMDVLHTDMKIQRIGYEERDLRTALENESLAGLPLHERLLVAMAINRDATVVTAGPRLRDREDLPVSFVEPVDGEPEFPEYLERLYEPSLKLRVNPQDL